VSGGTAGAQQESALEVVRLEPRIRLHEQPIGERNPPFLLGHLRRRFHPRQRVGERRRQRSRIRVTVKFSAA
jgi:hypothetical protein